MSYAGVERGPEWVAWAEQETIARLNGWFSTAPEERQLRRAARAEAAPAGGARPPAEAQPAAAPSGVDYETFAHLETTDPVLGDHPLHTHVSALSEPPDRHGPEWHEWAEAQTVLRLQQPRRARPQRPKPEPVVPDIQVELTPPRTIRINHENLKAVGI